MTRKEAKDILLRFIEENKYKSDWNGFLAGAILTYLEPINKETLNELAQEADIRMSLYSNTRHWVTDDYYREGFKAGYRKAMEE